MKKLIVLFCLFIFSIEKGRTQSRDELLITAKKFDNDVMEQFKKTTTVFFYGNELESTIDSLKKAITSVWDITPIIFEKLAKFDSYASKSEYSYFVIEGMTRYVQGRSISYTHTHYYLALRLFKEVSKTGKIITTGLYRIELSPNPGTLNVGRSGSSEDVINDLYKNGFFYNWGPVQLKAQLAACATSLKNNKRPSLFENIKDDNLTATLARDTLYVPKKMLVHYGPFKGKETNNENNNPFTAYQHSYRICTDEELYKIFETEKRGRLLFEYVKSSTDKYVSIFDILNKTTIYRRYTAVTYNLKEKDLEKIK
jgi:hypothetical protein